MRSAIALGFVAVATAVNVEASAEANEFLEENSDFYMNVEKFKGIVSGYIAQGEAYVNSFNSARGRVDEAFDAFSSTMGEADGEAVGAWESFATVSEDAYNAIDADLRSAYPNEEAPVV